MVRSPILNERKRSRAEIGAGDVVTAVGGRETATWETATLRIFDELLADARIDRVQIAHGIPLQIAPRTCLSDGTR